MVHRGSHSAHCLSASVQAVPDTDLTGQRQSCVRSLQVLGQPEASISGPGALYPVQLGSSSQQHLAEVIAVLQGQHPLWDATFTVAGTVLPQKKSQLFNFFLKSRTAVCLCLCR